MKLNNCVGLLCVLLSFVGVCEEDKHLHQQTQPNSAVEALSADLRQLLVLEMQALQTGMMAIIPAYISGNWAAIEQIAAKMKNSYILQQNLTEVQIHQLHTALPQDFIQQDQNFHYLAGMLEHAAQVQKAELVGFYFSEMNRACLACHTQFAGHKFPQLKPVDKTAEPTHQH